jgi:hypothetical protein
MIEDTLKEAVDHLRPISQFQEFLEVIRQYHNGEVRLLMDCEQEKIERIIGRVAAYRDILDLAGEDL